MSPQTTAEEPVIDVLEGELCPMCNEKTLTLTERDMEIPYFGRVYIYSMTCQFCKYHKADLETRDRHEPVILTFTVKSPEDLNVRVVKSGDATIKIPHIISVEPGAVSQGYVTNIEGVLIRVKHAIELAKEAEEELDAIAKAKNSIKKIQRAMSGQEELKIIIEDPSGNSAIISERTESRPLKIKKG